VPPTVNGEKPAQWTTPTPACSVDFVNSTQFSVQQASGTNEYEALQFRVQHDFSSPFPVQQRYLNPAYCPTQSMNSACSQTNVPIPYWSDAQFAPFGFIGFGENGPPKPLPCPAVTAVSTSYVPTVAPESEQRLYGCWKLKVHADGDRSTMSVHCDGARMECASLALKWKNTQVEASAEKKCIRIRGKDFEAEAEEIDFRQNEGMLVLTGNATIIRYQNGKCDCTVKAQRIVCET
jgi:hypothetical protein